MHVNPMNEPNNLGEDLQDQIEFPDPWGDQMFWGEEEVFLYPSSWFSFSSSSSCSPSPSPSPSAMFPHSPVVVAVVDSHPHSSLGACHSAPAMEDIPWSQSEDEGSSSQDEKLSTSEVPEGASYSPRSTQPFSMNDLLSYLFLKFRAMEFTSQAEMLSIIRGHEDRFPELLSKASLWLQLLLGIDVKEVDASNYCYFMVPTLGLTYDGMGSDRCSMPKTGLLVMVLCTIVVERDCASEEAVWETLNDMGLQEGVEHSIYGDLRELLTKVWVQEGYVEYRQVANSEPARYEFLWGPRAHNETTREQAIEFLHRHSSNDMNSYPSLSEVD